MHPFLLQLPVNQAVLLVASRGKPMYLMILLQRFINQTVTTVGVLWRLWLKGAD
jgi:hypothetical protein